MDGVLVFGCIGVCLYLFCSPFVFISPRKIKDHPLMIRYLYYLVPLYLPFGLIFSQMSLFLALGL